MIAKKADHSVLRLLHLAAAHRVAAGAREARARVVEGGGGAPPAAAFAAGSLLEGQRGCKRHHRTGRSAVGAWCSSAWAKPVIWQSSVPRNYCSNTPNRVTGSALYVCIAVLHLRPDQRG